MAGLTPKSFGLLGALLAGGVPGAGRGIGTRMAGMAGDAAANLAPGLLDYMMNKIFPPKGEEGEK